MPPPEPPPAPDDGPDHAPDAAPRLPLRVAVAADVPALRALVATSVRGLSPGYYTPVQVEAALAHVFGVDSQLVADGTYYVVDAPGGPAAAGGWSARRTLYGGDQAKGAADPRLDPGADAARIRAFFVHPRWARRGLARRLYAACARAAWDAGFRELELMATRPGEPLYAALGFAVAERVTVRLPGGVDVPFARMRRALAAPPAGVEVREESPSALAEYGRVPIAFEVRTRLAVVAPGAGLGGLVLAEEPVPAPYVKDYDADPAERPAAWASRFAVARWGILSAWAEGARVGGAAVAWDAPDVAMLEGRRDLAVLWDLRVAPAWRGRGVGAALLAAAERWALARGARRLKVETQNVNVAACRFYARRGCVLGAVHRFAYPALPDEAQLLWYKGLGGGPP